MIDAHVHLWRLGENDCIWPTAAEGAIHRDVEPAELLATLDAHAIDQALLVQSQESARDTRWLIEVAASTDRVAGVIGWAELRDAAEVAALANERAIRGLRPMVQGKAAGWYDDPALDAGLAVMAARGLVLDALIRPAHLPALDRLAARHPDLAIVIDHAAKPEAGAEGLTRWREAIAPLADRANVHVKLSGLLTELPRDAVVSAVRILLDLFGAERLLWGSDWPVLTPVASYGEWHDLASALIPSEDHVAVFGGNAAALYRIEEAAHA